MYYSSPSAIDLEQLQSLIHHAISEVIALHPSLAVTILDEDKPGSYFARLRSINLAKVVEFYASADISDDLTGAQRLDQLLEHEHNVNFSPVSIDKPLWRLKIIHPPNRFSEFVVSFLYHHAIADGTSGFAFHRSLVLSLRKAADARVQDANLQPQQIIALPEGGELIPTLESLHPLPLSISYIAKSLWREYCATRPSKLWTASSITKERGRSRFRSIMFSPDKTSKLVQASRCNSTSVTATLHAMLVAVTFSALPSTQYSLLRVDGAVSLRRWLPRDAVDDSCMGNYVSRYLTEHSRPSTSRGSSDTARAYFSWREARRIKHTIDIEVGNKGKDSVVGLLRFAGDLHRLFESKIGKAREESFEFSNIGVFSQDSIVASGVDSGKWMLGKAVFSQSADMVGAGFEVSLVTGADGRLNIGFSWLEGVVEESWINEVINSYKQLIEDVVADEAEQ
jgi:hypothetical protein